MDGSSTMTMRAHTLQSVMQHLARVNVTCVPQPPYSPDIAPCDFFLFPTLKAQLQVHHFDSTVAVVKVAEAILKDMSKNGFAHGMDDWQKRSDKCIQAQ